MNRNRVKDIRQEFQRLKSSNILRGNGTIEIQNAVFVADSPSIFGVPNQDYINAEIEWYLSQDKSVDKLFQLYGKEVAIWKSCADRFGDINSNYGWCIFSHSNHKQYDKVLETLEKDPLSRQAVMIYTNPYMHSQAYESGMRDFMCTNTVQYFINEDNYLECQVNMRSNDAVFGYMNDVAWQTFVLQQLADDLDLHIGSITWCVGSLHVYERHYELIK